MVDAGCHPEPTIHSAGAAAHSPARNPDLTATSTVRGRSATMSPAAANPGPARPSWSHATPTDSSNPGLPGDGHADASSAGPNIDPTTPMRAPRAVKLGSSSSSAAAISNEKRNAGPYFSGMSAPAWES